MNLWYSPLDIHFLCTSETQVEALTNQEEVELRSKIEALGLEVTKVPTKSTKNLDEVDQDPIKLVSNATNCCLCPIICCRQDIKTLCFGVWIEFS